MERHDPLGLLLSGHLLFVLMGLMFLGCGGGGGGSTTSNTTNQSPNATLTAFSIAASGGDNTTALSYFTQPARDSLQIPLSDRSNLIALGNSMGKAVEYKKTDNTAVFTSTYVDNGTTYSFYIYLAKDDSGAWKIVGF